jgi:hypothetical protein
MLAKMVRGTFLLTIAVMFVVWAVSLNKSAAQAQQDDQLIESWTISC